MTELEDNIDQLEVRNRRLREENAEAWRAVKRERRDADAETKKAMDAEDEIINLRDIISGLLKCKKGARARAVAALKEEKKDAKT